MFDGKFIYSLLAVVIAVLAICNFKNNKSDDIIENFANGLQGGKKINTGIQGHSGTLVGSKTANPEAEVMQPWAANAAGESVARMTQGLAGLNGGGRTGIGRHGFMTPGTAHANLSPRGAANNFSPGTRIRYNTPAARNTAYPTPAPNNVENYTRMVRENYAHETGCPVAVPDFSATPTPPQPAYADGNWTQMQQSLPKKSAIQANEMVMNSLPIPTMSDASAASVLHDGTYGASADGSGEPNVVNYNRMMISLAKSQNTRHGCPIRGDLAITPNSGCWFQTSLKPGVDTAQGAMQVIGGFAAADPARTRLNAAKGQHTQGGLVATPDELMSISAISDLAVPLLPNGIPNNAN
jgi:hypothetical protein